MRHQLHHDSRSEKPIYRSTGADVNVGGSFLHEGVDGESVAEAKVGMA